MNIIPFHMHENQECVQAKKDEVKKIAEEFKAVKVVDDVGQFKISSRFVLWHKKHSDGRVQVEISLEGQASLHQARPQAKQVRSCSLLCQGQERRVDGSHWDSC